jgi:hypothetical protein
MNVFEAPETRPSRTASDAVRIASSDDSPIMHSVNCVAPFPQAAQRRHRLSDAFLR